jgi:acetyl esterase/lipase
MKKLFATLLVLIISIPVFSQHDTIVLWPGGAPGALGNAPEDIPVLICYHAKNNPTHAAVLLCPGGGYITIVMDHGEQFGEWFNSIGVSAYVVKYRVNSWDKKKYAWPSAFNDASRAMRYIRYKSEEWNLDTSKIGIMGFSAGGHVASTVGTHFDSDKRNLSDPIDKLSARPNFMILCYPLISIKEPYANVNASSRSWLLGNNADSVFLNQYLSNETQVKPNTPPTFIFQTNEDKGVLAEHAVNFYLALRKAGIPAEMHIFEPGKHGIALAKSDSVLSVWPSLLKTWLIGKNIVAK